MLKTLENNEFKYKTFLFKSFLYLLQLCEYDQEIELRDHARIVKNLLIKYSGEKDPKRIQDIKKDIYSYPLEMFDGFLREIKETRINLEQDFLLSGSKKEEEGKYAENELDLISSIKIGSISNLVKKSFFNVLKTVFD